MRKLILAATAAVILLTGCLKDKELSSYEDGTIAFRTLTDKAGKAATTDGSNILSFTVTGIKQSDNGYLFNGFGIARGESSNWDYTPKRFWPSGDNVDFYAYSPTSSRNVSTGLTDFVPGVTMLTYTVPSVALNNAQEDFLIARITNQNETTGAVKLNFQHALSRVTFSAKTTQKNITYIITGVKLINLNSTAEINLTDIDIPETGTFNHDGSLVIWDDHSLPIDYSIDKGNAPLYLDTGYASLLGLTNGLMVMPQETKLYNGGETGNTMPGTGIFAIEVSYKAFVGDIYYAGSVGSSAVKYFPVTIDKANTPITFEIGRQYNFYLTFGDEVGDPIQFEVEVGAWSNNTAGGTSVQNYASPAYFSDVNFLEYLVDSFDRKNANGTKGADGMLSYDELMAITAIDVPNTVANLAGINLLSKLTTITLNGTTAPTIPTNTTVTEVIATSTVTDLTGMVNLVNLKRITFNGTTLPTLEEHLKVTEISIGSSNTGINNTTEITKVNKLVNLQKVIIYADGNFNLSGNSKINDIQIPITSGGGRTKVNLRDGYTSDDITNIYETGKAVNFQTGGNGYRYLFSGTGSTNIAVNVYGTFQAPPSSSTDYTVTW